MHLEQKIVCSRASRRVPDWCEPIGLFHFGVVMITVVFTDKDDLLEFLNEEQTESPEDFLVRMEDALEQGLLTEDEVILLMKDFIRCK